ncbi:MAG: vancomycin high temperature exclusion protein [Anaerolineaceae bacterium]
MLSILLIDLILIPVVLILFLMMLRAHLVHKTKPFIIKQKGKTTYTTAIVFGAGINRALFPSKVLLDRMDKAIQLFQQDELNCILLSGGKTRSLSESAVMRTYFLQHGIPSDLILIDEDGISTFDTLKRAKSEFNIRQAVLITQSFHLPRAIALAQTLEMDVIGIAADTRKFKTTSRVWWFFRELFAWPWALIKVKIQSGM